MRKWLLVASAGGWLAGAGPALAAPCAGFTDVDSTLVAAESCTSVEWLRNRQITLGCTPALYCPGDPVLRVTMAAFLNRLAKALAPETIYTDASGGGIDLDNPTVVCQTNALPITGYPRHAQASGSLSARADAATANVDLHLVQSTDGGASWTPINAQPMSAGGTAKWFNAAVNKFGLSLAVGTSYRFGIVLSRSASPVTTGDLTAWGCQIAVVLYSRIGTSSPF